MYHVVRIAYRGEFVTYHIYKDNKPAIVPTRRFVLGKKAAYGICDFLNDAETIN